MILIVADIIGFHRPKFHQLCAAMLFHSFNSTLNQDLENSEASAYSRGVLADSQGLMDFYWKRSDQVTELDKRHFKALIILKQLVKINYS